jgi:hypothetical protein
MTVVTSIRSTKRDAWYASYVFSHSLTTCTHKRHVSTGCLTYIQLTLVLLSMLFKEPVKINMGRLEMKWLCLLKNCAISATFDAMLKKVTYRLFNDGTRKNQSRCFRLCIPTDTCPWTLSNVKRLKKSSILCKNTNQAMTSTLSESEANSV